MQGTVWPTHRGQQDFTLQYDEQELCKVDPESDKVLRGKNISEFQIVKLDSKVQYQFLLQGERSHGRYGHIYHLAYRQGATEIHILPSMRFKC